jgi:S1-C subfamily serine protease
MRLPTESPCLLAASLAAIGVFFVAGAQALEPDKVFEKASPSVVTVVAMRDPTSKEFQSGSGIVIDPDTVITNCHVLQGGKVVVVKIGKRILPAKLQFPDVERDLCQLSVADLQAPAIQFSSTSTLRVGQRVFAIGNPRQLELTMSDGIISSLRDSKDGAPIVQTTAPISPGSSGGGLFDTEGRLIGITTFQRRDSQNLNFALPVDWIRDVPARGKENLAKYKAGAPVSAPAPIAPAPAPYQPRIASIAPQPATQAGPSNPEWDERIALLEKNGAQTLTQALAVLFDVTGENEVNLIQPIRKAV